MFGGLELLNARWSRTLYGRLSAVTHTAVVILSRIALADSVSFAFANRVSATEGLKELLNTQGLILLSPARSYIDPGGFLLASKQTTAFIDLPRSSEPPSSTSTAVEILPDRKNILSAQILTGLVDVLNGSQELPEALMRRNLSLRQLTAEGRHITYKQATEVVEDSIVRSQVKSWLNTRDVRVFLVSDVFTTTNIRVEMGESTGIPLSAGIPQCNSERSSANGLLGGISASSAQVKGSESTRRSLVWRICQVDEYDFAFATDTPLVFAVAAFQVTIDKNLMVHVAPISRISGPGVQDIHRTDRSIGTVDSAPSFTPAEQNRLQKAAAKVAPRFNREDWEDAR